MVKAFFRDTIDVDFSASGHMVCVLSQASAILRSAAYLWLDLCLSLKKNGTDMTKVDARLHMLDWLVPLGFGTILFFAVPLQTALELSWDEGYELMKALLVSRGYALYLSVWSDQPPVFTELLALLFRVFGASAFVGRLLTLCFAMTLVWMLWKLVSNSFGLAAGLIATALLVSSSSFLEQSVAPMTELPATTLALASLLSASRYDSTRRMRWLALSGVLFGCALQVKLTSAIFLPAMGVAYLDRNGRNLRTDLLRDIAVWFGAVLVTSGLIVLRFYGTDTVWEFWASHFSGSTNAAVPDKHTFKPAAFFLGARSLSAATALGIALLASKRRRDVLCPATLFATVLAIHWVHRPYWYYYSLHFAIPMAWLGAAGIVGWFGLLRDRAGAWWERRSLNRLAWLVYVLVITLTLADTPRLIWSHLRGLRNAPLASENELVVALRKRASNTSWVFSDRPLYPFWAGLLVPPEMAGIPYKRIWSGSVTESTVYECIARYRPEEILFVHTLRGWQTRGALAAYIRDHYEHDPTGGGTKLFHRTH